MSTDDCGKGLARLRIQHVIGIIMQVPGLLLVDSLPLMTIVGIIMVGGGLDLLFLHSFGVANHNDNTWVHSGLVLLKTRIVV